MSRARSIDQLHEAIWGSALTTFRVPSGDGMLISIDERMKNEALAAWCTVNTDRRRKTFELVRRAIKSSVKRRKRGKPQSQRDRDEFACDCALWLVHEMLEGRSARHIVKA